LNKNGFVAVGNAFASTRGTYRLQQFKHDATKSDF
jgi:hypothetical protein